MIKILSGSWASWLAALGVAGIVSALFASAVRTTMPERMSRVVDEFQVRAYS